MMLWLALPQASNKGHHKVEKDNDTDGPREGVRGRLQQADGASRTASEPTNDQKQNHRGQRGTSAIQHPPNSEIALADVTLWDEQ
jgi:hypothetical protein